MSRTVPCAECQALLQALRLALAGGPPSPARQAEIRAHSELLLQMLQGSEDATDQLLTTHAFRAQPPESLQLPGLRNPGVTELTQKLAQHCKSTGHLPFL